MFMVKHLVPPAFGVMVYFSIRFIIRWAESALSDPVIYHLKYLISINY
mgnify:CR=1 FL=1